MVDWELAGLDGDMYWQPESGLSDATGALLRLLS